MNENETPPEPVHEPGTRKGEDMPKHQGTEPGRQKGDAPDVGPGPGNEAGDTDESYRKARDSTKINPDATSPIDPDSPEMPPA